MIKEDIERVCAMALDNKTSVSIAAKLGYTRKTIIKTLKEAGLYHEYEKRKKNNKSTPEEEQLIAEKFLAGIPVSQIAEEVNRSGSFIRDVLERRNLRKRTPIQPVMPELPRTIITEKVIKFKPPYLCTVKDKRTGKVTNYYDVTDLYVDKGYSDLPEWKKVFEQKGIVNFGYGFYQGKNRKEIGLDKWIH